MLTKISKDDMISVSNDTLLMRDNMEQIIDVLKTTFLFDGISTNIIKKCVLHGGCERIYFNSSDIMQSAKGDKKIGVILSGKAVIKSGDDGVIIRKLQSGDVYGAAILFDSPVYLTKVYAMSSCAVLAMNKSFVENAIDVDRKIAYNYIRFLSGKIGFLNSKISAYTAKSAENKLLAYLLQLPEENGTITLKTDYSAIARMIGIGRASLYRSFEKLENDGLIIKDGKNIKIKEEV